MKWDAAALGATIETMRAHRGDLTSIEVKRGSGGIPNLATTLCAFGNMPDGGTIIVGLDEAQRFATTGVSDPAAVHQAIAAQARTAVDPPLSVELSTIALEGKQVVVAQVAGLPVSLRPCRTGGNPYLRQADGDYRMSAQEEQQMLAVRDRPRFDATAVEHTSVDDLDPRLLNEFVQSVRQSSRRLKDVDDLTLLRRKGVLEPDGDRVTVGGLYALGEYPQQHAPSLSVTIAAVPAPGSTDRLIDLATFDGPIPDLLESCVQWLSRNLHTGIRAAADGHNYDHPELPLPALREIVANALVHRDLGPHTQSKSVEIRLLPDRLVVSSPGGLWGLSRDQLGTADGKSAVNEHLYEICKHLRTPGGARLIEGEGGGIAEAQRMLSSWPADPPLFIDKAVRFTAIVMRPSGTSAKQRLLDDAVAGTGDPSSRVLMVLADGPLDRNTISLRAALTFAQTKYALRKLIGSGHVMMHGKSGARNTTYSLAEED